MNEGAPGGKKPEQEASKPLIGGKYELGKDGELILANTPEANAPKEEKKRKILEFNITIGDDMLKQWIEFIKHLCAVSNVQLSMKLKKRNMFDSSYSVKLSGDAQAINRVTKSLKESVQSHTKGLENFLDIFRRGNR